MTTTRIKTPIDTITTREEMEAVIGHIASLKAQEQRVTGQMNQKITDVRKGFEDVLAVIAVGIEEKTALAKDWADRNPAEFGARKSLELTHGTVGWRIGQPSLKTLPKWTWDRVHEKLKSVPLLLNYLRVKHEINKELILADRDTLGVEGLKEMGVRVVQAETFFIEPRIEATETRLQEAA